MTTTLKLETPRLQLHALSYAQLKSCLENLNALKAEIGYDFSPSLIPPPVEGAIQMKLNKMVKMNESQHPWLTYWLLVIKADSMGAGLLGFKGFPDADGASEIGYGIVPEAQRKGFTTEAAQALIEWAFEHPACNTVTAIDVRNDNIASIKVLEKLGFQRYQINDETQSWKLEKT